MAEKLTKVTVEAQAKGFEVADRGVQRLRTGLKTISERERDFVALDKAVSRAAKQFASMGTQLQQFSRAFKLDGPLAQMKEMDRAVKEIVRSIDMLNTRGVGGAGVGGAGPAGAAGGPAGGTTFRNIAAGTFAGHMAANALARGRMGAAGLLNVPFSGAAGMTQALGSIPIIGGPMAAMTGMGIQAAQQWLAYRQQQYGMSYLGGPAHWRNAAGTAVAAAQVPIPRFDSAAVEQARQQGIAASRANLLGSRFDNTVQARYLIDQGPVGADRGVPGKVAAGVEAVAGAAPNWFLPKYGLQGAQPFLDAWANNTAADKLRLRDPQDRYARSAETFDEFDRVMAEDPAYRRVRANQERLAQEAGEAAARAEEQRQRAAIEAAKRKREQVAERQGQQVFRTIEDVGVNYGRSASEAMGVAQEFLGASGGDLRDLATARGQLELRTAFGAQARYGLGAGTTGLLSRGMHAGQVGRPGETLEAVIQQGAASARARGLQGADVGKAVEEIARRVGQWEQTGLPVAPESLAGMQAAFSTALGAHRGSVVGAGFLAAQQSKSLTGPQSNEDIYELAALYGYRPGSGAQGLEDALLRQEANDVDMAGLQAFTGAGGDAYSRLAGFERSRRAGLGITRTELRRGLPNLRVVDGAGSIAGEGSVVGALAPDALQRQARTENARRMAGERFVGTAQSLDAATVRSLQKMGDFGPSLEKLANWASDKGDMIFGAFQALDNTLKVLIPKLEEMARNR